MRLRSRIIVVTGLMLVLTIVLFSIATFKKQEQALVSGIDAKLETAARLAREILPKDYHDKITGPNSVSETEYLQIVGQWNRLCQQLELEYIWSLMLIDGKTVFTSGSSTSKDLRQGDYARFFELHTNPEIYKAAFASMEPQHQINDDKWGRIRAVLIPFRDSLGRPCLLGASMKMTEVDSLLKRTALQSLGISVFILAIGVFLCALLAMSLTRPLERLTQLAESITMGKWGQTVDESGTFEIRSLACSINVMTASIQEKTTEVLQREERLRESEANLRQAQKIARMGRWELDIAAQHLVWSNEIFAIFEVDPDTFVPSYEAFLGFIHPDDRARVDKAYRVSVENKTSYEIEHRLLMEDGRVKWVNEIGSTENDEFGKSIRSVGIVQDITERMQTEKARIEEEERYRILFDRANVGIVLLSTELGLISINESFARMHGYTPEEMHNMNMQDLDTPETAELIGGRMHRLLAGEVLAFEVEHYHKDGHVFPVEVSASPISIGGEVLIQSFHRDITERKQAEKALRDSENKCSRIIDTANEGVWTIDDQGKTIFVNARLAEMLGYLPAEMIGQAIDGFLFQEDLVDHAKRTEKRRNGQGEVYERRYRKKDGRAVLSITSAAPLMSEAGQFQGSFAMITDITAYRHAEEEKSAIEAQLQQSQKMESVGRLAGGVAHDFNNMLGVILGHTELAMQQADPSQPLYADLEQIRKTTERSADLTRQLLAFARKQTIAPKVLDLNETLMDMLKMLQRLIGEDISLNWQPAANLWKVRVDPSQMDQILANLCVNARDAIADVGKVTIETENSIIDEDYCQSHAGSVPGEYVRLAVSDNGSGMDRETQKQIFEPFFTSKGVGKGTGLGLATVYGAVKQNNGFINVYSELGLGTTFTIYLPRHTGHVEQEQPELKVGPDLSGNETILLVEDEPNILRLTARLLEGQGYTVLEAGTPSEAIRLANEYSSEIQLLITDVIMPEMNGRELTKTLLTINPRLRRLFMSGYTADIIANHGVLDEGVFFIQKPFSIQKLSAKVREVLEQSA